MELRAESIAKKYPRARGEANWFYAVKGADIAVRAGRMCALMGRSGSGKTTLMCMLGGLLRPDEGRVTLDGQDVYSLKDAALSRLRNRKIAFIPQRSAAIKGLTALENILLPASLYGEKPDVEYARSLMRALDIEELSGAQVSELSGGEMRRVAIVRALAARPQIVLADEPTGDLDDESTSKVLSLLTRTARNGAGVMIVTHESAAAAYADETLRMDAGILVG